MSRVGADLTGRDLGLLRAVAAGRCTFRRSCEPVLLVDDVPCADFTAARRLIAAGLVEAPVLGRVPAPAVLTPSGRSALALRPAS
ncbi:hypothetical protein [Pseudonocardia asaccharolytica]|uniref:Uncharacterized protein n=1 Tax=Pseudonocardia asaccharolytica DSM 44247 = NBRC 16224 TaxID=1123024 RepID=A0A511CY25_9PSEU|nr:hypothetical protein [Pseudonocardia asaccharolytica]GEL17469.1 hypothetical protein PA7_13060 [Pseudonocardia asaccharolytica DSM 44247 = NBRC 16224]